MKLTKELRAKLLDLDENTDWVELAREHGLSEVQVEIRGKIKGAIERIDKSLRAEGEI